MRGDFQRGDLRKLPRQEQGNPAAHARPHEHRGRPLQRVRANRRGLPEPRANRALLEPAAGLAMARIIEPQGSRAVRLGPLRQRARLDASHVRLEAAEPDKRRLACFGLLEAAGDGYWGLAIGAGHEQLQFFAVHPMLLS